MHRIGEIRCIHEIVIRKNIKLEKLLFVNLLRFYLLKINFNATINQIKTPIQTKTYSQ